jgi:TolB-like protein
MLSWPPPPRRPREEKPVDVTVIPTGRVPWAIIVGSLIISAAIAGNGYLDRKAIRAQKIVSTHVPEVLPSPEKSIAVLKFEKLGSDAENALYVDGIREDIVAQLAAVPGLKVADLDPRKERQAAYSSSSELGRELGVVYLVRGSTQQIGSRMKLRTKLVKADADQTVWTETYEFEVSDGLSSDPGIAKKIAEELLRKIGPATALSSASPGHI